MYDYRRVNLFELSKNDLLQHRAEIRAGDHTGVAAQPAGLDVGLGSDILCLALGQHLIRNFQRDAGVGDVDVDGIAFLIYMIQHKIYLSVPMSNPYGLSIFIIYL